MKKEDFLRHYSGLSNIELLKILEEKEKYQPTAIEIAQQILFERNYSNDEMSTAKAEVNFFVNKKKEQQEKTKKKINEFIDDHFEIRERTPERTLNMFCIGIFLYTLIDAIFNIRHLAGYYYSTFTSWSIAVLIYLIQFVIIYLLYKRNNWGWILLLSVYVISAIFDFHTLYESFYPRKILFSLNSFRINRYYVAIALFFSICVILFLNKNNIFQQFSLAKDTLILTIVVSAIISLLFIFIFK